MDFLSKLEPSLFFFFFLGSYLCWKSGHRWAGAGRKRRIASDLKRVCSGCRVTAVEEVGWLQGHCTQWESSFSCLHHKEAGSMLGPWNLWGRAEQPPGPSMVERACSGRSSPSSVTEAQQCVPTALITLSLLPAWRRRESLCVLPRGPPAICVVTQLSVLCCCVCFAAGILEQQRGISSLSK